MPSFGETLKRERELRQITLREVAEATKINVRYLDALERNEFRHLPGGVFNKGFVRAYAEYVGIDPQAMVDAYLDELRSQETKDHEQEAYRRTSPSRNTEAQPWTSSPDRSKLIYAAAGILVLVSLLVAGGFAAVRLWPSIRQTFQRLTTKEPRPPAEQGMGSSQTAPSQPQSEASGIEESATAGQTPGADGERARASAPAATEPQEPRASEEIEPEPPAQVVGAGEPATAAGGPVGTVASATAAPEGFDVIVHVDRVTTGVVDCDGRAGNDVAAFPAGSVINLRCREYLLVDVADGGALRLSVAGGPTESLGAEGEAVRGRKILAPTSPHEAGPRSDP
jgi:cytoskeletal protein RodZ